MVHALESEIENGIINVCGSEEASRMETSVGRTEISILTMEISIVKWKFLVYIEWSLIHTRLIS